MTKDEALALALHALHTKGEHHPRVYEAIYSIQTVLAQPPLRERKPLTDEEIQAIWDVAAGAIPGWSRHIAYGRAIEAAHGIGGAKP